MPKFDWGISSDVIDDFDRSQQQFVPYSGPIPPNGVYAFTVKRLKYVASKEGRAVKATLRIGLELKPRNTTEKEYAGYFVMTFRAVRESNVFSYISFLDAINVSGTDFTNRTIGTTDGDIQKIGRWQNDGRTVILAQLIDKDDQNGNARKDIGWMGPATVNTDEDEDEEEDESDEDWVDDNDEFESDDDDEFEEDDDERVEARKPVRRTVKPAPKKPTTVTRGTARRRRVVDDVPF